MSHAREREKKGKAFLKKLKRPRKTGWPPHTTKKPALSATY